MVIKTWNIILKEMKGVMLNTSLVNSSTRKIFQYVLQTQATFNECLFYISIYLLSFSLDEPQ